jgi:hypothetical protein
MDTERRLDDAIDDTVRDMMAVEPHPEMRQRVLARLQSARQPWLTIPRLAAGAALTMAVVIIVLFVDRTSNELPDRTVMVHTPEPSRPSPHDMVRVPDNPAIPPTRQSRRPAARVRAAAYENPTEATPTPVEIVPLDPLVPIVIARVEPDAIATREITIPALTVDRLEVEPLSPPR